MIWSEVQAFIENCPSMPMFCMGDLNNIMNANEKLGPNPANAKRIADFCCMVKTCGLFDLGYNGPAYTWTNKRFSSNPTYERLDRCLGNVEWCSAFPNTVVYHLPMMKSDHAPILAMLNTKVHKYSRSFKFENWWLLEDDYELTAKQSWRKYSRRPFHLKTHYLVKDLNKWRKSIPKISDQLKTIEDQILNLQMRPPHQQSPSLQKELAFQHESLLAKNDVYHRQRFKKNWSIVGDRNTSFFHQSIIKRARKNTITRFHNPDGTFSMTQEQLARTANQYFMEIFSSQDSNNAGSEEQDWPNDLEQN
jgi:hypothetical protein